jgi:subtilisin family serine protease
MAEAPETKLDAGLFLALQAYEADPDARPADDGISISLKFEGPLSAIEALGFEPHSVSDDEARGVVRFRDVRKLAAHAGVLWMEAGLARRVDLEAAPFDIRARATTAAGTGSGGDGLWHAVVATGALTQAGNATGAGVIVAVIDTGIDITHPMFMRQLTPTKATKILRIWDQGLPPASLADCPPVALIQSPNTYGVEFDETEINAALNGGTPIEHKDCIGHGTHVAGIAAGGVKFPVGLPGADASRVGVAPEADLIMVKYIDNPPTIRFRLASGFGAEVGGEDRFRDAVLYCLRTARNLGKPIVINMSFGNPHQPGDALDSSARWVDSIMDPTRPAGPLSFPTGAIVVTSSGNDGNTASRSVARIEFPPGPATSITVPLELKDTHGPGQTRFTNCAPRFHSPTMFASFWYRRDFDRVKFAVKFPHRTTFTADMTVGGNFDHGFIVRPGTPPTLVFVPITPRVHRVAFRHGGDPAVPHPAGGTVRRHNASMSITPKVSGGTVSYLQGIYEVRITAPGGTVVYFMGDFADWGASPQVATLSIANTMANGDPLPPAVASILTSEFSATDTLGAHAITVAAYDDNNLAAGPNRHAIADFSSRGPLRDFSDPPGSKPLVANKPDLAAPGVAINSAWAVHSEVGVGIAVPPWTDGVRFIPFDGTSMSAPIVAGVIALMLDKVPTLNTTTVRTILTAAAAGRPGINPAAPGTAHDRAYGAGMVDARKSHDTTVP